jgi:hypothetical protein
VGEPCRFCDAHSLMVVCWALRGEREREVTPYGKETKQLNIRSCTLTITNLTHDTITSECISEIFLHSSSRDGVVNRNN